MRRPRAYIKRGDTPKIPLFSTPVGRMSKRTTAHAFTLSYRSNNIASDIGRRPNFIGAGGEHPSYLVLISHRRTRLMWRAVVNSWN
jgi:hypothetical protein